MQALKNALNKTAWSSRVAQLRSVPGKAKQMYGDAVAEEAAAKAHWTGPGVGAERGAATNGLLFGEPPLAPGQKRVRAYWERLWWWSWGAVIVTGILAPYPDTLNVWAREEALERRYQWAQKAKAKSDASAEKSLAFLKSSSPSV